MSETPLKPCPFCGGKAEMVEVTEPSNVGGYVVQCTSCEVSTRGLVSNRGSGRSDFRRGME